MDTILTLVDFSEATDEVVKTAADFARALGTKLILIHVAAPDADYEGSDLRHDISRTGVAREMQRYHQALHGIETELKTAGIDATSLLVRSDSVRGNPVRKIIQEMGRIKPGLVVVGSHGHGPVHDVLLGSVSSAVLHQATSPVLVVPVGKIRTRVKRRIPV
jgi:nucleotide-binding universal stress UspA family protein